MVKLVERLRKGEAADMAHSYISILILQGSSAVPHVPPSSFIIGGL